MGDRTGMEGWVPLLRGLKCQPRPFVCIAGSKGEPLKTFEQESGSIGDVECQENSPAAAELETEDEIKYDPSPILCISFPPMSTN